MTLELRLLGGFEARSSAGGGLFLPVGKIGGLLAFLAMSRGRPQPRDSLASLFWERSTENQAKASLRQALAVLRKVMTQLGCQALCADKDHIWLTTDGIRVDSLVIEQLVSAGTLESLEQAASLYGGEFLSGFTVNSESFEEWARTERVCMRELIEKTLTTLTSHYIKAGQTDQGIRTALRLLALDPFREDVHRVLIGLYIKQDRRAEALRQYEHFRAVLRRELNAEPESETRHMIEDLLKRIAKCRAEPIEPHPAAAHDNAEVDIAEHADQSCICPPEQCVIRIAPFRLLQPTKRANYAAFILQEAIAFSLSRFKEVRVVDDSLQTRHGSSLWGSHENKLRPIGSEFLLEGTVCHASGGLRLWAGLKSAATGQCLWVEEYRASESDLYQLESLIVPQILAGIGSALEDWQLTLIRSFPVKNLRSYPMALLARAELNRSTPLSVVSSIRIARQACRLDPGNSLALVTLALAQWCQVRMGWARNRAGCLSEAMDAAQEALVIDHRDAMAHGVVGLLHLWNGLHDIALRSVEHGLSLNLYRTELLHWQGLVHDFSGEHERAIECHRTALRIAPQHRLGFAIANSLAGAYYQLQAFDHAAQWARESISLYPSFRRSHANLAASLAWTGDEQGSARALATAKALDPHLSLKSQLSGYAYRDSREVEIWEAGYKKAGLRN